MTTAPQRRANTTLAFHASRIVIDVGVILVMAAMSLPFVQADTGNRSSVAADALPALILVLPIFAITLIPDHTRPIPRPLGWASLVLGLAAFPYAVVKFFDAGVLADTLGGTVGMGARLLVFGTFVVVAGIAVGLTRLAMNLPSGGTPGARTTTPRPTAPVRQQASSQPQQARQRSQPQGGQQSQQQRPQPTPDQLRRRSSPTEHPRPDQTQVMPRVQPGDSAPEPGPSEGA
jgi:hypothetical protein